MAEIFSSISRFKLTELVDYNGSLVPGVMKKFDFLNIETLGTDKLLTVEITGTRAGRPDLISLDLYGTPLFKWVLLMYNNVTNPFNGWPLAGTTIQAPNRSAVWREL